MLVRLDLNPICPLCGQGLQPAVLVFQHGYAFCQVCGSLPPENVLRAIGVMQDHVLLRHQTAVLGLIFWTPRSYGPLNVYACWQAEDKRLAELDAQDLLVETVR